MATIFYSMCGEGRGHATRVQTIVELLVPQHRFVLLAARDAYQQLYDRYQDHPLVSVRRLPGLFFSYRGRKVDYTRSLINAFPYLWRLSDRVRYVANMIEREQPSLCITDFEPILPRAAKSKNIPWISLDHQHFLSVSDFRTLPWSFRWRALFLRCTIPLFYSGQKGEAVSSFHHMRPRPGTEQIPRIGVLIRSSIRKKAQEPNRLRTHRHSSKHVLVYIRKHAPERFWRSLERCGRTCIVYGQGTKPARPNIQFKEISDQAFVDDLANSDCLITTAGNQLVGEAFYLNVPVLAIPEEGNFEQIVNAWLVEQSGGGWTSDFNSISPHAIQQFFAALPILRRQITELSVCGNEQAIQFIQQFLPVTADPLPTPFLAPDIWEPETIEI